MNYGHDLPCNIEAEQAMLGALLVNNDALFSVPGSFAPEHFFEGIHQQIYDAIRRGVDAGKSMNPVTVRSFMAPEFANVRVGDRTVSQYLAMLCGAAVTISGVPGFADAITEYHHRREAMSAGEDASIAGVKAKDELDFVEKIKSCRDRLTGIINSIQARNDPEQTFAEAVDATFDKAGEAMAGRKVSGLDLGIPEITSLIGPLGPGELLVLGGDVKTGKSAAVWQCFFNMAERYPVAGFSGEMGREQIIQREKARRTGISAKRQKRGQLSSHELDALLHAGQAIKKLKYVDIISKPQTLDDLDERINRLQGQYGIECFVVDHILKLLWTGKMEDADDFKKANRATSTLKNIAMKRNIPIIALTHINKNSNDGIWGKSYADRLNSAKRRRPTYKSMLGNIDKDVDNMIIVHQAYPAVAAMEPEEGTADYALWEAAMNDVKGRAEFILALSRENEFPRRQEVEWHGESTSFGPPFYQARVSRGLFA